MSRFDKILEEQKQKLRKAFNHLDYSYLKIENLPTQLESLSEDQLADWEAYSARFSRVVEYFLHATCALRF
jgi:hypothetical protein